MIEIDNEIKKEFMKLSNDLSPENLHCDGEISHAQAQVRYKEIMKQWLNLEKKVGRSVGESEVWEWIINGVK